MKRILLILLLATLQITPATVTETDGDWSASTALLRHTPEAAVMVRVGDIDNLGFGWPPGFDPFSGATTPGHGYPWAANPADPAGTDRIMVLSSYVGRPPAGADGYTTFTARPDNAVQPITLDFDLAGLPVIDAAFQMFVDDFQAPAWGALYTVTLNAQRFTELEELLNSLVQTGPVGKLISIPVPNRLVPEIASGHVVLTIDDLTTGAGDGYAVDFVKLLLNRAGALPAGTISGFVTDATSHAPIPGASIVAFDKTATTDSSGAYTLTGIPAGLAFVEVSAPGYHGAKRTVDLPSGQTVPNFNFELLRAPSSLDIFVAVELEFFAYPATAYVLQFSSDLQHWTDDETIAGEGRLITRFRTTRNANARYWRLAPR